MRSALSRWASEWTTALGAYFPGERVVLHGQDLFTRMKDPDWMKLLIFGVCGRYPDEKQIKLLNAIWTYGPNYPDPRLWNNRVGALAAASRSTGSLGVGAGIAVSEATIYGHIPVIKASELLLEINRRHDNDEALADILKEKIMTRPINTRPANGKRRQPSALCGFGRPVSHKEERLEPIMKVAGELGLDKGPVLKLAIDIEKQLLRLGFSNMYINAGGLAAALYCDLGFSPREQYYLSILQHGAGIVFCAADAAQHPEGGFFPLPCGRILSPEQPVRNWEG